MKYWHDLPARTKVLVLLLVLTGGAYAYGLVDRSLRERELDQAAQKEINGIRNANKDVAYEVEVAYEVKVTRPYILFGNVQGEVDAYVRQKSLGDSARIHEVVFYYKREGGEWKSNGGGGSAGDEAHERGLRLFARRNHTK